MSLSTIIAKVILKILEAFGIKPPVQDKRKIMQDKQAQDAFANALKRNPKLGQMLADSDLEPPKPRTLGTLGSAGPVTVDAQNGGPLINHVPRPLDDAHFGGLSTAGEVATEPAPILPPEATDPTDAPDWIDDKYGAYDPNWKQK